MLQNEEKRKYINFHQRTGTALFGNNFCNQALFRAGLTLKWRRLPVRETSDEWLVRTIKWLHKTRQNATSFFCFYRSILVIRGLDLFRETSRANVSRDSSYSPGWRPASAEEPIFKLEITKIAKASKVQVYHLYSVALLQLSCVSQSVSPLSVKWDRWGKSLNTGQEVNTGVNEVI